MIGVLPQGFPVPSFPAVPAEDLPVLFAAALGISLVAIGDTISVSGGFAARAGYEVDGNQELAGIGTANLAAGLVSGFPVSTSGSRTAVAFQSGAKTQLTGLVAAGLVMAMLLFLPGLVQAMPQPVLAAVVIAASIGLFDVAELRRLYRVRRIEFVLAVACALGVMFIGVLEGIVVAVALSVIYIFKRAWQPYSTVLGRPEGIPGYHDIRRYPDARPGAGPPHRALVGAAVLRERHGVPGPDPRARQGRRAAAGAGSSSPRSRSRTSTRRRARSCATWTSSSTRPASASRSRSSSRTCAMRSCATGCWRRSTESHLYPSVTEAVTAFREDVARDEAARAAGPDRPEASAPPT